VSEKAAIAAGMAEFRRTIRPRLRVHALVLVGFAALVATLAELPLRKIIGTAGLAAVVMWVVLAWVERTWLPANLRDRYRRSQAPQP
jgi:hypothetical protein